MELQEMVRRAVKQAVGELQYAAALQRLDQRGELKYTMADMPSLVQEVLDDVSLRHKDKIIDFIYRIIKGEVSREAVRGLAKWYKNQLATEIVEHDLGVGG